MGQGSGGGRKRTCSLLEVGVYLERRRDLGSGKLGMAAPVEKEFLILHRGGVIRGTICMNEAERNKPSRRTKKKAFLYLIEPAKTPFTKKTTRMEIVKVKEGDKKGENPRHVTAKKLPGRREKRDCCPPPEPDHVEKWG